MAFSNTKLHFGILLPILLTFFFLQFNKVKSFDSFCFTTTDFGNDIILQGQATTVNGILQLTKELPDGSYAKYSAGRALLPSPIQLWKNNTRKAASFSTSFSFILNSTFRNIGDGLTFFLASVNTDIPRDGTGGKLGVYGTDAIPFVAVEFDTFINDWDQPRVPHIGVNINNQTSERTITWNTTGVQLDSVAFVRINYDAVSRRLSVSLTYPRVPNTVESSLTYDNIALKDYLPEWVRVGLSASTGLAVEGNRVLSWSFSSNLVNINSAS